MAVPGFSVTEVVEAKGFCLKYGSIVSLKRSFSCPEQMQLPAVSDSSKAVLEVQFH